MQANFIRYCHTIFQASQVAQVVKNPSANAGAASLIPGSGRSPGEVNGNPLIVVGIIPWTEEPGGLESMESKKSDMPKHTRIISQSGWTNLYSQHQSVRIPVDLYSLK